MGLRRLGTWGREEAYGSLGSSRLMWHSHPFGACGILVDGGRNRYVAPYGLTSTVNHLPSTPSAKGPEGTTMPRYRKLQSY
ncbi:MAG: hypothetical protein AAGG75_11525 [Bacteroidota bacterium]